MLELAKHPSFGGRKGPLVLCIMDGVGYGGTAEADAVTRRLTSQVRGQRRFKGFSRDRGLGSSAEERRGAQEYRKDGS